MGSLAWTRVMRTEGTARWFPLPGRLPFALRSGRPHAALRRCPACLDCLGAEAQGTAKESSQRQGPLHFGLFPKRCDLKPKHVPLFPAFCPTFSCHLGQNREANAQGNEPERVRRSRPPLPAPSGEAEGRRSGVRSCTGGTGASCPWKGEAVRQHPRWGLLCPLFPG